MGVVHRKQMLIGNRFTGLWHRFQLCLNDVASFPQHFCVPFLFQCQDGKQAIPRLFVEMATEVDVQVMGRQIRKGHVNVEFIPHAQHSASQHASEITRLGIRRHQPVPEHVAQGVKMVRNGIDVGQRLGDGGELFSRQRDTSLFQFGQEHVDEVIAVDTGFNVHDAVESRHLAQKTVKVQ